MTYIILLVPLDQFARQSRFVVFALRCRGRRSGRDLGKLLLLLLLEVAPQHGAHLAVAEDLEATSVLSSSSSKVHLGSYISLHQQL